MYKHLELFPQRQRENSPTPVMGGSFYRFRKSLWRCRCSIVAWNSPTQDEHKQSTLTLIASMFTPKQGVCSAEESALTVSLWMYVCRRQFYQLFAGFLRVTIISS